MKSVGRVARQFSVGSPLALDGEFSVGREALVDEILPCIAKVLNVWGHVVWGMFEEEGI